MCTWTITGSCASRCCGGTRNRPAATRPSKPQTPLAVLPASPSCRPPGGALATTTTKKKKKMTSTRAAFPAESTRWDRAWRERAGPSSERTQRRCTEEGLPLPTPTSTDLPAVVSVPRRLLLQAQRHPHQHAYLERPDRIAQETGHLHYHYYFRYRYHFDCLGEQQLRLFRSGWRAAAAVEGHIGGPAAARGGGAHLPSMAYICLYVCMYVCM